MFDSTNQVGIDEDDAFSEYSNWENLNTDFPEEEGSPICLNENEFSLSQSNEEEGEEHSLPEGLIKSSFAADFYQSGTDWSSLRVNSSSDPMKLKQTNLFQMWGLKRHRGVGEEEEIDTGLWKSPSQKLAQGLGEPKAYINPTSTPHMIDVGLKSHTFQLDRNNPPRSAAQAPAGWLCARTF